MCVHLFAAMLLVVASSDTPKNASTPDSPLFDVKYLDTMREVKVAPPPVVAPAADSVAASAQRPALNVNQSAASESPKPSTPIEPIATQSPSAQNAAAAQPASTWVAAPDYKTWLLWGGLVLGVLLLAGMAYSLIKSERKE